MKEKDWIIPYSRPIIPPSLADAGYPPLLTSILALRDISTAEDAHKLICGGEDCLHDPLLIMGMDKARDRVLLAIERGETVAVYGDYDVDGITATCIVTDYLRGKGLSCTPYIPDRSEEGYGLNCSALDSLREQEVTLVITVDCGITAVDEARHASELGIDMVITDHHECSMDALPDVCAMIDCRQAGDTYPNRYLAGVGMAMKLVCACEGSSAAVFERYADLAAIGTVADVMPLVGENRYIVRRGLEHILLDPRPGIAAMLRESSIDPSKLTATSIGYSLAPRLNAAGRLGQAVTAAKLLLSEDDSEATLLAQELCELNRKRQAIEYEIWQEASRKLADHVPDAPIVLASENWHQGVIGIAASRLAEQYSLPSIMICLNGEVGKGSCRSYGGFNLYDALSACSEHLMGFGGHALAAGLNIRKDKLDDFRAALGEYYRKNRPLPVPEVQCDLLITDPEMLSVENVRSLELLEPYGNRNPKPVLCLSGVRVESPNEVGGGKHLRLRVRMGKERFECIYFSHNLSNVKIYDGDCIDLAFTPQINDYRGTVSVQLVVCAMRSHDPSDICDRLLHGDDSILWALSGYCPEREDFVRLWRSLGQNFRLGDSTSSILDQCISGMPAEKFCLCLMTLLETGLLSADDGSIFSAKCRVLAYKADLGSTKLIKTLKKYSLR